jgi:hypothetical protein
MKETKTNVRKNKNEFKKETKTNLRKKHQRAILKS